MKMKKGKVHSFVAAVSATMIFATTLWPGTTVVLAESTYPKGEQPTFEVSKDKKQNQDTKQTKEKTEFHQKNEKKTKQPDMTDKNHSLPEEEQDEEPKSDEKQKVTGNEDKSSDSEEKYPNEEGDENETDEEGKESETSNSNDEKHDASKEGKTKEHQEDEIEDDLDKVEETIEEEDDEEDEELRIEHEPITKINKNEELLIEASVPNANKVMIQYQTGKQMQTENIPLQRKADTDIYQFKLRKEMTNHVFWSPVFYYSIHAENEAGEKVSTDVIEVDIVDNKTIDYNQIPPLLITEITPDTANVNKKDAYEFIEVYNNTNQPIQMNDYEIIYRYPDGKADFTWKIKDDKTVEPQDTFIVWIHNEGNKKIGRAHV